MSAAPKAPCPLAVMRDLTDLALNSGGRRGEEETDNEPAIKLYENAVEARAKVAALVAADREYDAAREAFVDTILVSETGTNTDERKRLQAAIARRAVALAAFSEVRS